MDSWQTDRQTLRRRGGESPSRKDPNHAAEPQACDDVCGDPLDHDHRPIGHGTVDAQPRRRGWSTVYRLLPSADYTQGCFPPCLCPIMYLGTRAARWCSRPAQTPAVASTVFDYRVDDVNWLVAQGVATEHRVTGSGILRRMALRRPARSDWNSTSRSTIRMFSTLTADGCSRRSHSRRLI